MKRRTIAAMGACAMAAGLIMTPAAAMAASTESGGNEAYENDLRNADIIDPAKTGSLTIRKYDITAAEKAGAYQQGSYAATGEKDSRVEQALSDYGIEGVVFSCLRVGAVETHCVLEDGKSKVQLVYELPEELAKIVKLSAEDAVDQSRSAEACSKKGIYHYTAAQVQEALGALLSADNVAAKNALENYLYETGDSGTKQPKEGVIRLDKTDSTGYTQVDALPLGLYLVVETEVPENVTETVNPWFVQMPFTCSAEDRGGEMWLYDMTCYPKNQTGNPTLDKSVRDVAAVLGSTEKEGAEDVSYANTASVSEGDVLDYILVSKLPHITSTATYLSEYTFTDQLSKGLSYNKDAKIAFYHTAEDANSNILSHADLIWDGSDGKFLQTYNDALTAASASYPELEGGSGMVVSMTKEGLAEINEKMADYYMVVYYTATAHVDDSFLLGDEGNTNDVTLTWSRTSDGYYDTLEDRNYVYSYAIDLTKEFSDQQGNFSKVRFKLYNSSNSCYVVAEKEEDGQYHVTGRSSSEGEATEFVPAKKDGKLYIAGLEADVYQLTETATDLGYSLLKEELIIDITSSDRDVIPSVVGGDDMYVGPVSPASATVNGEEATMDPSDASAHAAVVLQITNSKGFLLPQTGGNGLYAITILGVIAVAGGCCLVTRRRSE